MKKNKKNKKNKKLNIAFFLVFFAFSFLFFQTGKVFAAELFIGAPEQTKTHAYTQGDEFLAKVFLDTAEDSINTVQANIFFPDTLLELKEIRDGNSIINFWVTQPKVAQTGAVSFSGIITGGYTGTTGPLLSLVFLAKSTGSGAITFDSASNVLLNDGNGTQASLKTSPLKFSISNSKEGSAVQSAVEPVKDDNPPDDFTPEVVQNSEMFSGKYFLAFAAQDKGSGIDYYEIYETKGEMKNLTNVKWNIAESPYVLQDQKLQSFIYVRAIDKEGNGKIEVVGPRYSIKWYETWRFWFIIIITLVIIIVGLVAYYLSKNFYGKKK